MSRRGKQTGASSRPAKVGELIRQELGKMLEDGSIKDPRLYGKLVTVTGVDVTPDLQHAKAFVSIFTEEEEVRKEVLSGLGSASSMLRHRIGTRLQLRYAPEIRFAYDESIVYGARIQTLFNELKDQDEAPADAAPDHDPDGDGEEDA